MIILDIHDEFKVENHFLQLDQECQKRMGFESDFENFFFVYILMGGWGWGALTLKAKL